jgi:hypothetical protein
MNLNITKIQNSFATVWLAHEGLQDVSYHYGGTRLIHPNVSDESAIEILSNLTLSESAIKNRLINLALEDFISFPDFPELPGLQNSKVGGGRCIIRPETKTIADILSDTQNPFFMDFARQIFAPIGKQLNQMGGILKLTPDFGRFAGLADVLAEFTEHSLGISCNKGGCGGKSSFTATGILEVIDTAGFSVKSTTIIGVAGALGSDVLKHLSGRNIADLAVSDIVFDPQEESYPFTILSAEFGKFTTSCLSRGGLIIATTIGNEFENSDIDAIPVGTVILLAHNHSLPDGPLGFKLAELAQKIGIILVPGQLLTFGGALASRVEYFWRLSRPGEPFDKIFAHYVVRQAARNIFNRALELTVGNNNFQSVLIRLSEGGKC